MDHGASSYHRFVNGDESGFAEIVKDYSSNLMYFINGFVNNLAVAEDIMEDVFVELIVYKNRYKGKSSFKTFLFSIARNKAVDYIRKNKNELYYDIEKENAIEVLENCIIKSEQNKIIVNALEEIKSEYKAVLILLYFEDMSYNDISKILRKTNKQVKNLTYSARKLLRAILEMEGFSYEEI